MLPRQGFLSRFCKLLRCSEHPPEEDDSLCACVCGITLVWPFYLFYYFILFCFILLFCFLGPHLWHMEVSRLGSKRSYSCQPTPQPQQCGSWAMSMSYITAHGNARSPTYWARPGIKPASSWILVVFISTAPQWELQSSTINRNFCNDGNLLYLHCPVQ